MQRLADGVGLRWRYESFAATVPFVFDAGDWRSFPYRP
jgi:hypothetical protein